MSTKEVSMSIDPPGGISISLKPQFAEIEVYATAMGIRKDWFTFDDEHDFEFELGRSEP